MARWRYACPEGHRSLEFGRSRVFCHTCDQVDQYDQATYPKEEITDLQEAGQHAGV